MSLGSQTPAVARVSGDEVVIITHEDVDRAHDRVRVSDARAKGGLSSRARLLWLLVGPGVLSCWERTTAPACCLMQPPGRSSESVSSCLSLSLRSAWPLWY